MTGYVSVIPFVQALVIQLAKMKARGHVLNQKKKTPLMIHMLRRAGLIIRKGLQQKGRSKIKETNSCQ